MTVATEPNTAALAQCVEASFMNPLESAGDSYNEAVAYVAAIPAVTGVARADSLRAWFLGRVEMLKDPSLRQSEREYIHGKCAHAAMEMGFLRGDLDHDWRR